MTKPDTKEIRKDLKEFDECHYDIIPIKMLMGLRGLCDAYDEAIDFIQSIAFTKISYNQYAITNPKAVAWLEDHVLLRDADTIFSDKESKL